MLVTNSVVAWVQSCLSKEIKESSRCRWQDPVTGFDPHFRQRQIRMSWSQKMERIGVTAVMVGGSVQLNVGVGWIDGKDSQLGKDEQGKERKGKAAFLESTVPLERVITGGKTVMQNQIE